MCVRLPDVPVIVTVAGPTVALPEAVNVNTLPPVVLAGLKEAVTPAGRPLTDKPTTPLKAPISVTATVLVPLVPWTTLAGEADRE